MRYLLIAALCAVGTYANAQEITPLQAPSQKAYQSTPAQKAHQKAQTLAQKGPVAQKGKPVVMGGYLLRGDAYGREVIVLRRGLFGRDIARQRVVLFGHGLFGRRAAACASGSCY